MSAFLIGKLGSERSGACPGSPSYREAELGPGSRQSSPDTTLYCSPTPTSGTPGELPSNECLCTVKCTRVGMDPDVIRSYSRTLLRGEPMARYQAGSKCKGQSGCLHQLMACSPLCVFKSAFQLPSPSESPGPKRSAVKLSCISGPNGWPDSRCESQLHHLPAGSGLP